MDKLAERAWNNTKLITEEKGEGGGDRAAG